MNRNERRRIERENQKVMNKELSKAYAMKQYHDDIYNAGVQAGRQMVIKFMMNMTAYMVNYKLGLGKKRLSKFMHELYATIDCYNTGQLDRFDYEEIKDIIRKLGFCMED